MLVLVRVRLQFVTILSTAYRNASILAYDNQLWELDVVGSNPTAPTIFLKLPVSGKTIRLPLDLQAIAPQTATGTVQAGWGGDGTFEPSPRSDIFLTRPL
jgi:hypothetical protein